MSIDNLIKSILSNWQECDGVEIAVSFSNNEFSASVIEDGLCSGLIKLDTKLGGNLTT